MNHALASFCTDSATTNSMNVQTRQLWPKILKQIHKTNLDDRKILLIDITETPKRSRKRVERIVLNIIVVPPFKMSVLFRS